LFTQAWCIPLLGQKALREVYPLLQLAQALFEVINLTNAYLKVLEQLISVGLVEVGWFVKRHAGGGKSNRNDAGGDKCDDGANTENRSDNLHG
jgi:hypothetical protein